MAGFRLLGLLLSGQIIGSLSGDVAGSRGEIVRSRANQLIHPRRDGLADLSAAIGSCRTG